MRKVIAPLIALGIATQSQSAILISTVETGSSVVFTISGSIDTSGTNAGAVTTSAANTFTGVLKSGGSRGLFVRPSASVPVDSFAVASGPAADFGIGASPISATSFTGSNFEITNDNLVLSDNYISGSAINGSLTLSGTVDSNNLTAGTYVWTLAGSGGETVTLDVVPEPSSIALLGLGGLACFFRRRR